MVIIFKPWYYISLQFYKRFILYNDLNFWFFNNLINRWYSTFLPYWARKNGVKRYKIFLMNPQLFTMHLTYLRSHIIVLTSHVMVRTEGNVIPYVILTAMSSHARVYLVQVFCAAAAVAAVSQFPPIISISNFNHIYSVGAPCYIARRENLLIHA
jgi:hypothetical protein